MKFSAHIVVAATLLPVSLWAATITGTISRADSTTKVIAGAKIVALLNNAKVDSTTTNTSGQYTLTLTAGTTYALQFSAMGYKDSLGYAVRSIMMALTTGANILNVNLTPATSTISGRLLFAVSSLVPYSLPKTEAAVPVAKIVLQRQPASNGNWLALDSTLSDSVYNYKFPDLIAAMGGTSGGYYRLRASAPGYYQYNPRDSILTVAMGATLTYNVIMFDSFPMAVFPPVSDNKQGIHFSRHDNQLLLDLEISSFPRSIKIFDLTGALQHQVSIPAGKTQAFIPATLAPENGFFFILE